MQARFLLGPAGSGKTFRCVEEARRELLRSPEGPPLVFLAPKQATFQIERRLLALPDLKGYARLQILSFERLAALVFEQMDLPAPELLSEEGRVMVLRALLARHHADLKMFRASARMTGFAAQLSTVLRELQRSRVSVETLGELANKLAGPGGLRDKVHDLALLLGRYQVWLGAQRGLGQRLEDANRLLDLAVDALNQAAATGVRLPIGALWLDGFAEMTPQETALLAAVMPHCERATLAFCLEGEPREEASWLSPWTVVGRTYAQCREAVVQVLKGRPEIEVLPRSLAQSRFIDTPELLELERAWANNAAGGRACPHEPAPRSEANPNVRAPAIRLAACQSPAAEATFAAREILQHVQSGGRFRDCAILVRSLDRYHDLLRRVLHRYEIPFFLDRREPVAHHPMAELARYALRTVAFDWHREDWFGALKTGLSGAMDAEVDWLENEALKRGWAGEIWRNPLKIPDDPKLSERLEAIRQCVMPAFGRFAAALRTQELQPSGTELAGAIRRLWLDLKVESQLEAWMEGAVRLGLPKAPHGTVWTQLNEWLDNLELAFSEEAMPLREWLPIIEAGLSGMSVGVIPPSLDQVLIGSVDRSRNPDLQKVLVLGVNEGVFPAPPAPAVLLTDSDRLEMQAHGVSLGATQRQRLGHERYFGYIAFTRPRQQLIVTWAGVDEDGLELNPSSFVSAIKQAAPGAVEETHYEPDWTRAVHRVELPRHILAAAAQSRTILPPDELPEFTPLLRRWGRARHAVSESRLNPELAGRLYGVELDTSVGALEDFAACPFRFVAARALRAQERDEFVVDARHKGSFQHEVLQKFHERVRAAKRRWRELTPGEGRRFVREIGNEVAQNFEGGLMAAGGERRFTASVLIGNLEALVETLLGWAPQYGFDPAEVEVGFGLDGAPLPAWRIPLEHGKFLKLRGRMDRIDVCRTDDGLAWVVICDYKSSGRQMDAIKIEAGLELQLLSYLRALTRMPEACRLLDAAQLKPAGVFYVPLRGPSGSEATRGAAAAAEQEVAGAFQHRGCFDGALLARFDNRGRTKGDQFRFALNKGGEFSRRGNDALPAAGFPELLAGTEAKLRSLGERIFNGGAAADPYRLKQATACDYCPYRAVCRFDSWTMPFRPLGKTGEEKEG